MSYIKCKIGTGVSQVKFTDDGKHLLVASRRDNTLQYWDIRYLKEAFIEYSLSRCADTNQRMYFDLLKIPAPHTPSGYRNIVASGNTDGSIVVYDMQIGECLGVFPS